MLSVKDPVLTVVPIAEAATRTSAEDLADRFRAFPTARLSWRLRVARRDAEAASRLAASAAIRPE
jgi:hypothetical protein